MTTELEPLHVRVRREFFKAYPGDPSCAWCHGHGNRVNTAEEHMVEECDCVSASVLNKRPHRADGRTECQNCGLAYFQHKIAIDEPRDWSRCYSVIIHCNGQKIQI